jgi:isopropylmalate/homocitrate/citramalate synthase
MSNIIHDSGHSHTLVLHEPEKPQLYRELFPYTSICRTSFDEVLLAPRPAEQMRITDTTFRDGQQARPPYTVKQVAKMFDFLHRLGGKTGLISASEFFLYSARDRKCIDVCRARGYRFPRVTAWIRANKEDLKLARDMEFDETGMLTSVSDYHIFLKLGKTRREALDMYTGLAEQALEWGIIPRCHFEDVTRADIYGFCLPLAQRLMELSRQSGMPVKIRLCDTMGYGVPYPGAALPRSVQRIVRAFTDEAGVPGEWLEWHGHNDFHKVLVNGVTAWLYGCGAVNATLFGFGERTGNTPLEALLVEYISLTGEDAAADTTILSEVAEFFEKELNYRIPHNYLCGARLQRHACGRACGRSGQERGNLQYFRHVPAAGTPGAHHHHRQVRPRGRGVLDQRQPQPAQGAAGFQEASGRGPDLRRRHGRLRKHGPHHQFFARRDGGARAALHARTFRVRIRSHEAPGGRTFGQCAYSPFAQPGVAGFQQAGLRPAGRLCARISFHSVLLSYGCHGQPALRRHHRPGLQGEI